MRSALQNIAILRLAVLLLGMLPGTLAAADVDYVRDVQPLLKKHCYSCHSGLRAKSGLRVDHISYLRTGGDRGSALAATSDESELIKAVLGTGDVDRMPLEAKPLADEEIATLQRWVDAGAPTPEEPLPADPRDHWSFHKPVRAELPAVARADWAKHPIDRFLAAEHERRGLEPVSLAPKHVLLRRVYLDLVGLPPTPEELSAFLADNSDDAYEKVVDRLLASPRYGERWGRHWMDVWRYSDWDGYAAEVRESQPHIWRWRDWIIQSLNEDKPYDQMIQEMLAADELAPLDANAERATGFLVRNWYKFNRNVWLEATVEHTSKAFLGITLNCARCHDHMYDPILQTEYYQFRAFFEPHQVRTDRLPGEADTKRDGLVRVFDADAEKPTFLFTRGNEASPDKEHPLSAGVPRALGGDPLSVTPVSLPVPAYYPGMLPHVQQETLAGATKSLADSEAAMLAANGALADARKRLAELRKEATPAAVAAAAATGDKTSGDKIPGEKAPQGEKPAEAKPAGPSPTPAELQTVVAQAERTAALAEAKLLSAHANLATVRAKLSADRAAFAAPPAAEAAELAREASRAERVSQSLEARFQVLAREDELAKVDPADKKHDKKKADLNKALAEARQAHEKAQAALGAVSETYARFDTVYPATSTGRRSALARWIASTNNPLTARVAINQIWMRHFGTPLVPTVFDFGLNGKPPTHPQLLDWLSVELMESGWKTKNIHRLIVTSRAYRLQSTGGNEATRAQDPENALLWRANARRMEAEAVRDSTLFVAGSLDGTMFGPELDEKSGLTVTRRSVYFRSSKEKKMTFLDTFDRANVVDCYRRAETIVPQQALALVNSSLSLAQARKLAGMLAAQLPSPATSDSQASFVDSAFMRVLCRAPSDEERATCLTFLSEQTARLADPKTLAPFTSGEANAVAPSADPAQRARENLIHVLLNHNDFLTVR